MTDSLLRRVRPRFAVTSLQKRDLTAAQTLCAIKPVEFVMPAMQVEVALDHGRSKSGGLWGVYERDGRRRDLQGVLWNGANLIPAIPEPTDQVLAAVADTLARRIGRPSALVGEAAVVLDLWDRIDGAWGPARSMRPEQLLMTIEGPAKHVPPLDAQDVALDAVRTAQLDDFAALLPTCVDMFTAEVGYDPLLHGRRAYEDRLKWLIRTGRSFVQYGLAEGRRQVVFKAEAGVVSRGVDGAGVAEMQGVWVHRALRGRGLARAGMSAVVALARDELAPTVSLYVNEFNRKAIRSYDAVGFQCVGTFATVMF